MVPYDSQNRSKEGRRARRDAQPMIIKNLLRNHGGSAGSTGARSGNGAHSDTRIKVPQIRLRLKCNYKSRIPLGLVQRKVLIVCNTTGFEVGVNSYF